MRMAAIDPGGFTARLVLERPVETPDGQGGTEGGYAALASLWARIEPVSARADEAAGTLQMAVTHRIWVRARGDLVPGLRLRKGERVFRLLGFRDPDETGRYAVLDCAEVKP